MSNCNCTGSVPIVSLREGVAMLKRVPVSKRMPILQASFAWLTSKHLPELGMARLYYTATHDATASEVDEAVPGLRFFMKIHGRPGGRLENWERDLIARDTGFAAGTPCPYYDGGDCLFGRLKVMPDPVKPYSVQANAPYIFLPQLAAREWDRPTLMTLLDSGQIASCKVALMNRPANFDTEDDLISAVKERDVKEKAAQSGVLTPTQAAELGTR